MTTPAAPTRRTAASEWSDGLTEEWTGYDHSVRIYLEWRAAALAGRS